MDHRAAACRPAAKAGCHRLGRPDPEGRQGGGRRPWQRRRCGVCHRLLGDLLGGQCVPCHHFCRVSAVKPRYSTAAGPPVALLLSAQNGQPEGAALAGGVQRLFPPVYRGTVSGGRDFGSVVHGGHDDLPFPLCHDDRHADRLYRSDPHRRCLYRRCRGCHYDPHCFAPEGAALPAVHRGAAAAGGQSDLSQGGGQLHRPACLVGAGRRDRGRRTDGYSGYAAGCPHRSRPLPPAAGGCPPPGKPSKNSKITQKPLRNCSAAVFFYGFTAVLLLPR